MNLVCLSEGGGRVSGLKFDYGRKRLVYWRSKSHTGIRKFEMELTLKYLGVTNFIWITGIRGENNYDEDTDYHIDGAAWFAK